MCFCWRRTIVAELVVLSAYRYGDSVVIVRVVVVRVVIVRVVIVRVYNTDTPGTTRKYILRSIKKVAL